LGPRIDDVDAARAWMEKQLGGPNLSLPCANKYRI